MMFHQDPFDPVEDVIAEAKQERAQLDRLLIISTPKERALLVFTAVVMLLFGTWLFFGDITGNLSIKGGLITPAEHEPVIETSLEAVAEPQAHEK